MIAKLVTQRKKICLRWDFVSPSLQRLFGLGDRSKVKPTFGVSFGLPYGYGQPYPLNPFGSVPSAINPFFGSVGPGGLSLGPVSVNPLVSIQVTKDEFGEKIIKPLVNLHVTPNAGLIHKFKGFVGGLAGGHGHGHPPPHFGPPPPFYGGGVYEKPPFHHHHPPPPPPFYGGGPFRGHHHDKEDGPPYDSEEEEQDYDDYPSGRGIDVLTNNTNSYRPQQSSSNYYQPQTSSYRSEYAPQYPSYSNPQNYRSESNYNPSSNPQNYRSESNYNPSPATSRSVKFPRNRRATTAENQVVSEVRRTLT